VTGMKVGDKVIVKNNFDQIRFDYDPGIDPLMLKHKNQVLTVTKYDYDRFRVAENSWVWCESWVDPEEMFNDIDENNLIDIFEGD
jgi:hypothetical protein